MDDTKNASEEAAELATKSHQVVEKTLQQLTKPPKKVEFKPVPVAPVEVKEETMTPAAPIADEHSSIESHGFLKRFFEIDSMGFEEGEKLRNVWAYLGEKFPQAPLQERLHQLRQIENKLGQPRLGQTRLGRIHDYLQAQKMVENAERWRDGQINK